MTAHIVFPARLLLGLLLASPFVLSGAVSAQGFDADRYLGQCLRFESGRDFVSAREACRNALQIDPDRLDVVLALARVEVQLGEFASSESRLRQLLSETRSAEPALLMAQVMLENERLAEAESYLADAEARLGEGADRELQARRSYLAGRLAEERGRFSEALDRYSEAASGDSLEVEYRLADARLRYGLGDPAGARAQLESYQLLSGEDRDPRVRSLLGRSLWAEGDLEAAAGQLETALALWNTRETVAQSNDLRTLGLVYLGRGDVPRGSIALREAGRRGNQLGLLSGNVLLWILVLLAVLVTHLLAESRIETRSTLEVVEGPQTWGLGRVYGVLLASLAVAVLVGVGVGMLLYDNLLAIVTPHQQAEVRALMWVVLSLTMTLLTVRQVRAGGWHPGRRLLGDSGAWLPGLLAGAALLVVVLGYLSVRDESNLLAPLWVDLSSLSPSLIAALILLPLTELFFRPFAYDALEKRYDRGSALFITAGLSTIVLGTPVVLLLPLGLVLSELYRRSRSGLLPLTAQLTLHVGLAIATVVSPWARGLFL